MSQASARFPHRILRDLIKQGSNEKTSYTLCRAIVAEVDTKGGKYNNGKSPINTVKAKITKPQLDSHNISETILWPLFDHVINPIFPTEEVLCIFETDTHDFGYWIDRISNIDKSFVPATDTVSSLQQNDASQAFGVSRNEQQATLDSITTSDNTNQDASIDDYKKYQKTFKFEKRLQDTVVVSSNTARIVLGNDRRDNISSGHDPDGEAVDIVVGLKKDNGDPSFEDDASRTYISSKSMPVEGLGNEDGEALWYVKSDNDALIARKDVLIQSKETKIKLNRDGTLEIEGNTKVTIHANEIIEDGTTTIGGTIGNKILTLAPGSSIEGLLAGIGAALAPLATTATVPAFNGAVSSVGTVLQQLIQAILVAQKSNAS